MEDSYSHWDKFKNHTLKLKRLNKSFFNTLQNIKSNNSKISIKELSYSFGQSILDSGKFHLPTNISLKLNKKYFYFGMSLEKSLETFTAYENHIIPLKIISPGQIFPITEFDSFCHIFPHTLTNISAGARSIFMSPKITDEACFNRLNAAYNSDFDIPASLYDEWQLLTNIANKANSSWKAKIIIFKIDFDFFMGTECEKLRYYLTQTCKDQLAFLQDKLLLEMMLSDILNAAQIKADPYVINIVKHLYFIGSNLLPGFVFAQDESLAPIKLLQDAFIKDYGVTYAPSVIQPGYAKEHHPCYYSMQVPILIEKLPKQRIKATNLTELKDIQKTTSMLTKYMQERDKLFSSHIYKSALNIEYLFLHQSSGNSNIASTHKITEIDSTISNDIRTRRLPFPESSPFLKGGCIAIQKKK